MDNVRPVVSFNSVEEFWGYVFSSYAVLQARADPEPVCLYLSLYNNIVPPSQLPPKANYYLFKVRRSSPRCSRHSSSC